MNVAVIPRLYQQQVVDLAKSSNLIIRADTGTGKTLCATLLIQHIITIPTQERKLVVFIAPTVPLVFQQAKVIEAATSLRVRTFVGAQGVDYWRTEQWQDVLEMETDVVVCTAQIWLKVMTNAYWSMERISLLIFDEAHHTQKMHPYCLIMTEHYHRIKNEAPEAELPKILGMTASPIFNARTPLKSIETLERNLDARLVEVLLNPEMAQEHAPKPIEKFIEFDSPRLVSSQPTLFEQQFMLHHPVAYEKLLPEIIMMKPKLGSYCSDLLIVETMQSIAFPTLTFGYQPDQSLQQITTTVQSQLDAIAFEDMDLSPQVLSLITLLTSYNSKPNLRAIVFVMRRQHVRLLSDLMSKIPELQSFARCGFLVGHGGNGDNGAGMPATTQEKIVASFRTGEINILFTTTVAEEGLDFAACNCIIRFDPLQTITGYIQSRGRARSTESDYIVLCEKDSPEAALYLNYVVQEPKLKALYSNRSPDEVIEPNTTILEKYVVESTGAQLTRSNAIPLLAEFCSLLPRDEYSPSSAPVYDIMGQGTTFATTLTLPIVAGLTDRVYQTETFQNKKMSKQTAAFLACIELHRIGALDDRLLPRREVRGGAGAVDADGREVDDGATEKPLDSKTNIEVEFTNVFGDLDGENTKTYLAVLEMVDEGGEEKSYIGVVTAESIESFEEVELFKSLPSRKMVVKVIRSTVCDWEGEERDQKLRTLREFNRDCFRAAINRRLRDEKWFLLWTPLRLEDHEIDWDRMENAFIDITPETMIPDSATIVLPHRRPETRIYTLLRLRPDVTSLSPTDKIDSTATIQLRSKYEIYPLHVQVKFGFLGMSKTEPESILELESRNSHVHNHLSSFGVALYKSRFDAKISNFPMSMCQICNLSTSFFDFIRLTPSLTRSIHDSLVARAFLKHYRLPAISLSKTIEALTPPGATTGYDYQTLETVGDSMLKLATTIHIFLTHSTADEGRLSDLRQNSVDNRFLFRKAISLGLGTYVLPQRFRTGTWVPAELEDGKMSGDGKRIKRWVGKKALADTMEAILGAALVTGGIEMALTTGARLDLCFGGDGKWAGRKEAQKSDEIRLPTTAPILMKLEEILGYRFQDGQLIVAAVTHRSYSAATVCYERLENLGDAVLDSYITQHLIGRFPLATPQNLTFARATLVSNPSLAFLCLRVLGHGFILHSSGDLEKRMMEAACDAEKWTWESLLNELTWTFDSPKVLGDVVESLIGAIFVDSQYNLQTVFASLDRIYANILPLINIENVIRDPHSNLVMYGQSIGCSQLKIKAIPVTETNVIAAAVCVFHDETIAREESTTTLIARQLVSKKILLEYGPGSAKEGELKERCSCVQVRAPKSVE